MNLKTKLTKLSATSILMFSLLNLILNSRIWVWDLFLLIPTQAWILPIFTLITLGIIQKSKLIVSLVITSFIFLAPFIDFPNVNFNKNETSENSIKVFNLNTQVWHQGEPEEFINYLKSQNADIYLLQEAFYLSELIDAEEYLNPHFPDFNFIQEGELVTMSKFPLEKIGNTEVYDFWQGYLEVEAEIEGQKVRLFNIHYPVPLDPILISNPIEMILDVEELFTARQSQFKQTKEAIENTDDLKIIGGDFNTSSFSNEMRYFKREFKDTARVNSNFYPTTFEIQNFRLWRIDWVFVDEDINVVSYQQIKDLNISDHDGILVELEIP